MEPLITATWNAGEPKHPEGTFPLLFCFLSFSLPPPLFFLLSSLLSLPFLFSLSLSRRIKYRREDSVHWISPFDLLTSRSPVARHQLGCLETDTVQGERRRREGEEEEQDEREKEEEEEQGGGEGEREKETCRQMPQTSKAKRTKKATLHVTRF